MTADSSLDERDAPDAAFPRRCGTSLDGAGLLRPVEGRPLIVK